MAGFDVGFTRLVIFREAFCDFWFDAIVSAGCGIVVSGALIAEECVGAATTAAVDVVAFGARFRGAAAFFTTDPSSFLTLGSRGFLVFLVGGG